MDIGLLTTAVHRNVIIIDLKPFFLGVFKKCIRSSVTSMYRETIPQDCTTIVHICLIFFTVRLGGVENRGIMKSSRDISIIYNLSTCFILIHKIQ